MQKSTWLLMLAMLVLPLCSYGQKLIEDKPAPSQVVVKKITEHTTEMWPDAQAPRNTANLNSENRSVNVLFDNGPVITHYGAGSSGSHYSVTQDTSLNLHAVSYAFMIGNPAITVSVADDFTVDDTWHVSTITFFGYQEDCGPSSSFYDIRFKIYDGDPSFGANVIYGDFNTNKFVSSQWINAWRVYESIQLEHRPIMEIVADASDLVLTSGTYWIEWQVGGTGIDGPWGPPVSIPGQAVTGNGMQNSNQFGWQPLITYGSAQGMPFIIKGLAEPLPANDLAISEIIDPSTAYGMDDGSVTVRIENLGTIDQSGFDISYTIDNIPAVTETVNETLVAGTALNYSFTTTADLSEIDLHTIEVCVMLGGDENPDNDCLEKNVYSMYGDTVYPQFVDFWTGSTDGSTKTRNSLAHAVGNDTEAGWMKFDLSTVPPDMAVTEAILYGYAHSENMCEWSITPMGVDPVSSGAADIWTEILAGSGSDAAYLLVEENVLYPLGQHQYLLGEKAGEDISEAMEQGWFALGLYNMGTYAEHIKFNGWKEDNNPYLVLKYKSPSPTGCNNFDELSPGDNVAQELGGYWTTAEGSPGGNADATVTDANYNSPGNSFLVDEDVDLLLKLGYDPLKGGEWSYSHYMMVPSGHAAHFNVQEDPVPGLGLNLGLYFEDGGNGYFDGQYTEVFAYQQDTWFLVEIIYSSLSGNAEVYFDGELIGEFENTMAIGGINYSSAVSAGTPTAYYDDVCFINLMLKPPENLTATFVNPDDVYLSWDPPVFTEPGWMKWHNGEFAHALGMTSPVQYFYVASRWDQESLTYYNGMTITEIEFLVNNPNAEVELMVWKGDNAGTLLITQPVQNVVHGVMMQVPLDNPIIIDATEELWFGYKGSADPPLYMAGGDSGPAIPEYGDMYSVDQIVWNSLYNNINFNFNFLLSAYVTYADGSPATQMIRPGSDRSSTGSVAPGSTTLPDTPENSDGAFEGYNIYRDNQFVDFVTDTTYLDENLLTGQYVYYVTALYEDGESVPSNHDTVDVIVGIDEHALSGIEIFPNPAADEVIIQSGIVINSIGIYDIIGQVKYSGQTFSKQIKVNLSQFEPGVYLFRVNTALGVETRRVIVQ